MDEDSRGEQGDNPVQEETITELISKHGWDRSSVLLGIRAQFRCEYCGRYLLRSVDDYDTWQIDHIIPKAKCGKDVKDHCNNLAIACKTCNFLKRDWVPDSWVPGSSPENPGARKKSIQVIRAHIQELRNDKEGQLQRIRGLAHRLEDYCVAEE